MPQVKSPSGSIAETSEANAERLVKNGWSRVEATPKPKAEDRPTVSFKKPAKSRKAEPAGE